jgi:hypothetical protein
LIPPSAGHVPLQTEHAAVFLAQQPLDFLSKNRKVLKGGKGVATLFEWYELHQRGDPLVRHFRPTGNAWPSLEAETEKDLPRPAFERVTSKMIVFLPAPHQSAREFHPFFRLEPDPTSRVGALLIRYRSPTRPLARLKIVGGSGSESDRTYFEISD